MEKPGKGLKVKIGFGVIRWAVVMLISWEDRLLFQLSPK